MIKWFFAFALLVTAPGCGTFDPANNPTQPWDSPTTSDVSQGWWVRDWNQTSGQLQHP